MLLSQFFFYNSWCGLCPSYRGLRERGRVNSLSFLRSLCLGSLLLCFAESYYRLSRSLSSEGLDTQRSQEKVSLSESSRHQYGIDKCLSGTDTAFIVLLCYVRGVMDVRIGCSTFPHQTLGKCSPNALSLNPTADPVRSWIAAGRMSKTLC